MRQGGQRPLRYLVSLTKPCDESAMRVPSSAMSIHTDVMPGDRGHVIHRDERGQELIGPRIAVIRVDDEPELSPYPATELTVRLDDGRYNIIDLRIILS